MTPTPAEQLSARVLEAFPSAARPSHLLSTPSPLRERPAVRSDMRAAVAGEQASFSRTRDDCAGNPRFGLAEAARPRGDARQFDRRFMRGGGPRLACSEPPAGAGSA